MTPEEYVNYMGNFPPELVMERSMQATKQSFEGHVEHVCVNSKINRSMAINTGEKQISEETPVQAYNHEIYVSVGLDTGSYPYFISKP